jgi:hypothetical protein
LAKEPTEILSAPHSLPNFFFLGKPSIFPGQSPLLRTTVCFLQ